MDQENTTFGTKRTVKVEKHPKTGAAYYLKHTEVDHGWERYT